MCLIFQRAVQHFVYVQLWLSRNVIRNMKAKLVFVHRFVHFISSSRLWPLKSVVNVLFLVLQTEELFPAMIKLTVDHIAGNILDFYFFTCSLVSGGSIVMNEKWILRFVRNICFWRTLNRRKWFLEYVCACP